MAAAEGQKEAIFAASISLEHLSVSIWSDLAPIKGLSAPLIQFLVS